jgi:hypothetical protein
MSDSVCKQRAVCYTQLNDPFTFAVSTSTQTNPDIIKIFLYIVTILCRRQIPIMNA